MKNTSKAGLGLVAVAIYGVVWAGKFFGLEIAEADAVTLVQNVIGIAGVVMTYWG
ncbi:MAG: hypothetical protein IH948_05490, partial [Bacteroidetes bacterium]|nr:hypothetical protein [Bacteroidota bacterium]